MSDSLHIGKLELRLIDVPEGKPPYKDEKHVWIRYESGEGMSTRLANIENLIEQFFAAHRRCDCGKWYYASRSDQKSCSATCRQRRHARTPEFQAKRRAYRKTVKRERKNNGL